MTKDGQMGQRKENMAAITRMQRATRMEDGMMGEAKKGCDGRWELETTRSRERGRPEVERGWRAKYEDGESGSARDGRKG